MFMEAIEETKRYGNEKWSVTLMNDRVRLVIGQLVVFTLHKGKAWLVLPGKDSPDFVAPSEFSGWETDSYFYKSISSICGYYEYSDSYHEDTWPRIRKQHFKFIEMVSQKYKEVGKRSKDLHSPGILEYFKYIDDDDSDVWLKKLQPLIENIELLKNDPGHTEKAHEVLVESFYKKLGFSTFSDIKYHLGSIDIAIEAEGQTLIVNEVKKDWNLSRENTKVLEQAYKYALQSGSKYVIITNGDYYALYDRTKGLSYNDQLVGEFNLSSLTQKDFTLIDSLKKENLI
jgi:hypothetical protein